jgi:hypothetical protein
MCCVSLEDKRVFVRNKYSVVDLSQNPKTLGVIRLRLKRREVSVVGDIREGEVSCR